MKNLVEQLVLEKREGDWWDFKLKHHTNLIDLLHDILCLSNVIYSGDRYIIFGVNDNYEIVGLNGVDRRNTQADILSFLRIKSFANHKTPNIRVDTLIIDGKELDVLTIKNESDKPYFLTRDESKSGSTVRAGVVYSRLGDSNTPKNGCASPSEIESMWRERFGLDKKVSERFISILLDFKNWKYDGISQAFYEIEPEFTIEIGDSEGTGGKFWWEESLFEKPDRFYYYLKYKNVLLHKILVIRFRSENLQIPFPDVEFVNYPEKEDGQQVNFYCDLFYYLENTISHSLFKHIRALEVSEISNISFSSPIKTQIKPPIIELPFVFFDSEYALKSACSKLIENFEYFQGNIDNSNEITSMINEPHKRYSIERLFSKWAYGVINNY